MILVKHNADGTKTETTIAFDGCFIGVKFDELHIRDWELLKADERMRSTIAERCKLNNAKYIRVADSQ